MGKAILITSGKGGVGKSTLAAAIAVDLARRGRRTVLVDADIGLRCADLMLNMQDRVVYDLGDILDGSVHTERALSLCPDVPGLKLLAAPQMMTAGEISGKDMRKLVARLKEKNDYVVIDCPAGIGRSTKNVLGCADETVIVCTMDDVSLRDAERLSGLLTKDREAHPFVVFNKTELSLITSGAVPMPKDLALALDMPLLGVIPFSMEVARSVYEHRTALTCTKAHVNRAIENICRRLTGESVPLPEYRLSLRARLRRKGGEAR